MSLYIPKYRRRVRVAWATLSSTTCDMHLSPHVQAVALCFRHGIVLYCNTLHLVSDQFPKHLCRWKEKGNVFYYKIHLLGESLWPWHSAEDVNICSPRRRRKRGGWDTLCRYNEEHYRVEWMHCKINDIWWINSTPLYPVLVLLILLLLLLMFQILLCANSRTSCYVHY